MMISILGYSLNLIFGKYEDCINSINDSVWQGSSKNNLILKSEEMVMQFKDKISSQLSSFSEALGLLKEYKSLKLELLDLETKYNDAMSVNDYNVANIYSQNVQECLLKLEEIKSKINKLLDEIKAKKVTSASARRKSNLITTNVDIPVSTTSSDKTTTTREFVNYYQTDYNDSYGYGTTISTSGCGPTSMAMVLTSMTGEEVSPSETAKYSLEHGHRIKGKGTDWAYFQDISKQYDINCEQTPVDAEKIKTDLSSGKEVIMSMGPGTFTSDGHFIVLTGINDDGTINVADPNSEDRSQKSYNVDVFTREGVQQWTFS